MRAILVSLALAAALAAPLPADDSIDALATYGSRIEKGTNAALSGTDPAEAFRPWSVGNAGGLEALRDAGVTGARFMGMEFELLLRKGGKDVYMLRTFAHASEGKVSFVYIQGEPLDGPPSVTFHPLGSLVGEAEPLACAARALSALLAGDGDVPFIDSAVLESLIPFVPAREEGLAGVKKSREGLAGVRSAVRAAAADEILVRVDDVTCVAMVEEGQAAGMARESLAIGEGGEVAISIGRYRPFPK
ncbi:MAG: hypothetical protein HY720_24495 [Planctomycetes bacterium]|nr:hypothetical protein [Planctomycetota bacterium]